MNKIEAMKSILGIGNALTDILAVLPDDEFLTKYHLPKGSMQHVDMALMALGRAISAG